MEETLCEFKRQIQSAKITFNQSSDDIILRHCCYLYLLMRYNASNQIPFNIWHYMSAKWSYLIRCSAFGAWTQRTLCVVKFLENFLSIFRSYREKGVNKVSQSIIQNCHFYRVSDIFHLS